MDIGNTSARQKTRQQLMAQVNAALAAKGKSKLKQAILQQENRRNKNDLVPMPMQSLFTQTTSNVGSLIGSAVPGQKNPMAGKSRNIQDQYKKSTKSGLIMVSPTEYNITSMSNYSKIHKGSVGSLSKLPKKNA